MAIKYLNLDELAVAPTRFLRLGGVEHAIIEQSVEGFIEAARLVEALKTEEDDEKNIVNQINLTVNLIVLSVPTMNAAALGLMPLASLGKIANFVRGIDDEEIVVADAEAKGKAGKK